MKILVIGAGIFGSVLAKVLKTEGYEVHVVDDGRAGSGSAAAGCLMKPSWVSELSKEEYSESMNTLESIVRVKDVPFASSFSFGKFSVNAAKLVHDVKFANPEELMGQEERIFYHAGEVVHIANAGSKFRIILDRLWPHSETLFDKIFVCAGVWSLALLKRFVIGSSHKVCGLSGMTGASVRWAPMKLPMAHMSFYSPYKQAVVFNIASDVVWGGDNCTVSTSKFNAESKKFAERTVERCQDVIHRRMAKPGEEIEFKNQLVKIGHRPFVKNAAPSLVEEIMPGLWVNTGGAKNGTLAAGWAANKIRAGLRANKI